jgi:hypothetical protein
VTDVVEAGVPLWHLAFLSLEMARVRGLGENYLLFGAYLSERTTEVEGVLWDVLESYHGRTFAAVEAYRVWGERFFPAVPSHPIPRVIREFVPIVEFRERFGDAEARSASAAVQGTAARSGDVLLLTFDASEDG